MRPEVLEFLSQMVKKEDNNKSQYLRKIGYYGTSPTEAEFKAMAEAYEKANAYKEEESIHGEAGENIVGNNRISNLLTLIAVVVFVIAFILGIVVGKSLGGGFKLGLALLYWAGGFVVGSMMLGFAEIVQLLQAIKDK